ncbi:DNA topoisomerase III beta [Cyclospora cayetanensis]|uniref:DNA topoisomerase n=1 Tax=Cyclospora cayetanensis TaxID=88456 RepID=A0A1D3D8B5_9EIME|nr:DNA topoisomerase III beta [Cyclospora cayetanensis]
MCMLFAQEEFDASMNAKFSVRAPVVCLSINQRLALLRSSWYRVCGSAYYPRFPFARLPPLCTCAVPFISCVMQVSCGRVAVVTAAKQSEEVLAMPQALNTVSLLKAASQRLGIGPHHAMQVCLCEAALTCVFSCTFSSCSCRSLPGCVSASFRCNTKQQQQHMLLPLFSRSNLYRAAQAVWRERLYGAFGLRLPPPRGFPRLLPRVFLCLPARICPSPTSVCADCHTKPAARCAVSDRSQSASILGGILHTRELRLVVTHPPSTFKRGIAKPRSGMDAGDHPPITPVRSVTENEIGGGDAWRMYELVARTFLATVSGNCKFKKQTLTLAINGESFTTSARVCIDPGFTAVLRESELRDTTLPNLKPGDELLVQGVSIVDRMTSPPSYLSESDLLSLLEKHRIGTDASMATHINNICERNYVSLTSGRRLEPTKLGICLIHGLMAIDAELVLPFPLSLSLPFSACCSLFLSLYPSLSAATSFHPLLQSVLCSSPSTSGKAPREAVVLHSLNIFKAKLPASLLIHDAIFTWFRIFPLATLPGGEGEDTFAARFSLSLPAHILLLTRDVEP